MNRTEAIKIIKTATVYTPEEMEALETLIPELAESEDERIRKWLYELIDRMSYDNLTEKERTKNEEWKKKVLDWLEKQKEEADKRLERVELHCKEVQEFDKKIKALRKEWYGEEQKEQDECPEYCVRSHCIGCSIYEKQKEQKPAWSEEDEDMLNYCISSIEEAKENRYAYKETDGDTSYDHEIAWLKSLPYRFSLSSWGEEIKNGFFGKFKSPFWKPSEEQMEALKEVAYNLVGTGTNTDVHLVQLYEQLKAL